MKNAIEANKVLKAITNKRGFKIYASYSTKCYVNIKTKIIVLNTIINDEENITLAHELGHIYIFKVWKWFILINEITAWIIGYFICKRNKVNTKNYWSIAVQCLKTYVK